MNNDEKTLFLTELCHIIAFLDPGKSPGLYLYFPCGILRLTGYMTCPRVGDS